MQRRDKRITAALAKLDRMEAEYRAAIAKVQKACKHSLILERPSGITGYQYIENSWFPAVRVCAHCGYVEEARYGWPTSKTTSTPCYNTKPQSESVLNRKDFEIGQDQLIKELLPNV